jgi:hypothetical protein
MLHRIERDGHARVRVSDHVDLVDAEMLTDGLEVVDIVMDAALDLRAVAHGVGSPAVSWIEEHDRAAVEDRREVVGSRHAVDEEDDARSRSRLAIEEAKPVRRVDIAVMKGHTVSYCPWS